MYYFNLDVLLFPQMYNFILRCTTLYLDVQLFISQGPTNNTLYLKKMDDNVLHMRRTW